MESIGQKSHTKGNKIISEHEAELIEMHKKTQRFLSAFSDLFELANRQQARHD